MAYGKLQLSDEFSISVGKLPTLVGAELPFTEQNANIERGLLWWQEPGSSRGVQANYASGPLSIALSWNDGYYTNVWNTFSGLISYAIDGANTLGLRCVSHAGSRVAFPGNQISYPMYTYNSAPGDLWDCMSNTRRPQPWRPDQLRASAFWRAISSRRNGA